MTLEETIVAVWRQILLEGAAAAEVEGVKCPTQCTSTNRLWQVDFAFAGRRLRGIEQNPNTKSRWAAMARSGKRVMQFLEGGRHVAAVVNGKAIFYGKGKAAK
ncbi:MAG: hypothetical protein WA192_04615 [Candidatus Acidiferrales bacterium]